jgi:hypothetical protein
MDAVIADSDSEGDDDSDSGLEDLSTILFKTATPRAPATSWGATASPAKRRVPTKPPPRVRIDMKSLLAEAKKNDNVIAKSRKAAAAAGGATSAGAATPDAMDIDADAAAAGKAPAPAKSDELLREIAGDERLGRARKALERTGTLLASAATGLHQFYFFDARAARSRAPPSAFPSRAATGPWAILNREASRHDAIRTGMVSMLLAGGRQLPEDVFLWMLDAAYLLRESAAARGAYVCLVAQVPAQVRKLVTPRLVDCMLRGLGVEEQHLASDEKRPALALDPPNQDRYVQHDFTGLAAWLGLVAALAPHMAHDAVVHTIEMLSRMAADTVLVSSAQIHVPFSKTFATLCQQIDQAHWNDTVRISIPTNPPTT